MIPRTLLTIALFATLLRAQQKKILVTGMGTAWIAEMQAAAPSATFVAPKPDEIPAQIADADAILGTISPALFPAAKKLKWLYLTHTGVTTHRYPDSTYTTSSI